MDCYDSEFHNFGHLIILLQMTSLIMRVIYKGILLCILAAIGCVSNNTVVQAENGYLIHKNITVTHFSVGEEAGPNNRYIDNIDSAWDNNWVEHFGGFDDPDNRQGYYPKKFIPKENPFYFALPFNDFDEQGNRRPIAFSVVPWANSQESWGSHESMCKNRWIKIRKNGKSAYAQWEDVGPFAADDHEYVFGTARPSNKLNRNVGLDVSPAVRDYLGLHDIDFVDWVFVDFEDVPEGPWKSIITTSQIHWE